MAYWVNPLTPERVNVLILANEKNGDVSTMAGPIGPMIKVACTKINSTEYSGKSFYCGGDSENYSWLEEGEFYREYPEFSPYPKMPEPEFDLDDMELAEIIMEELK